MKPVELKVSLTSNGGKKNNNFEVTGPRMFRDPPSAAMFETREGVLLLFSWSPPDRQRLLKVFRTADGFRWHTADGTSKVVRRRMFPRKTVVGRIVPGTNSILIPWEDL